MKVFILILTLVLDGWSEGAGGVAMQEFESSDKCIMAGEKWLKKTQPMANSQRRDDSFYLCVEK